MPDHVHLIVTPYESAARTLLLGQIKGRASYFSNHHRGARHSLWQRDSFDRIVRAEEDLERKIQYVCDNPVRKGLVERCEDYPWLWRSWLPAG